MSSKKLRALTRVTLQFVGFHVQDQDVVDLPKVTCALMES